MPNSQTRKKSNARSPKKLEQLNWLRNPYEQLKRSVSFQGKGVSDEEFFKFFEDIGEVWSPSKNKSRSKNRSKTKNKKNKNKK